MGGVEVKALSQTGETDRQTDRQKETEVSRMSGGKRGPQLWRSSMGLWLAQTQPLHAPSLSCLSLLRGPGKAWGWGEEPEQRSKVSLARSLPSDVQVLDENSAPVGHWRIFDE